VWSDSNRRGTLVTVEGDRFSLLPPDDDEALDGDLSYPPDEPALRPAPRARREDAPAAKTGTIPAVTWG
jgi:hypothetical protein